MYADDEDNNDLPLSSSLAHTRSAASQRSPVSLSLLHSKPPLIFTEGPVFSKRGSKTTPYCRHRLSQGTLYLMRLLCMLKYTVASPSHEAKMSCCVSLMETIGRVVPVSATSWNGMGSTRHNLFNSTEAYARVTRAIRAESAAMSLAGKETETGGGCCEAVAGTAVVAGGGDVPGEGVVGSDTVFLG